MSEQPAAKTSSSRGWTYLSLFLSLLFLIPVFLLLHGAAEPSRRAAVAARHGFVQLDNEEGALLFQAVQIGRGESIYRALEEPPYFAGTYTPLYMATVGLLEKNFDFAPGFTTGRYIVWVSALLIAVFLLMPLLLVTRNPALGVLTGFLFLATWEVHRWVGYFRVDFPAMALSLGGLVMVVLGPTRWWALAPAALFMTAALYTKQTMIAAPAACFLALLFRQWRDAVQFLGWMLLWGLPPLIALQVATDGQFLRHIIYFNMNTAVESNIGVWIRHILFMHQWFVYAAVLALPAVLVFLAGRSFRDWKLQMAPPALDTQEWPQPVLFHFWQPLACWALLAQWNIPAIAKAGSAENYLLEPIAGWAVLVTLAAGAGLRLMILERWSRWRPAALLLVAALLTTTFMHGWTMRQPEQYMMRFNPGMHPTRMDFQASQDLTTLMRAAENPFSELTIFHLLSGHPPVFQPFIMSELARQGKWNQDGFVDDIRTGHFDLVITLEDVMRAEESTNYTPEMLAAFRDAYEMESMLETRLWTFYVLRPRTITGTGYGSNIVRVDGVRPRTILPIKKGRLAGL